MMPCAIIRIGEGPGMLWNRGRRSRQLRQSTRALYALSEQVIAARTRTDVVRAVIDGWPSVMPVARLHLYFATRASKVLEGPPDDPPPPSAQECYRVQVPMARPGMLLLPLVAYEEGLGVLRLDRAPKQVFSEDEQAAAQHLATQISASLCVQEQLNLPQNQAEANEPSTPNGRFDLATLLARLAPATSGLRPIPLIGTASQLERVLTALGIATALRVAVEESDGRVQIAIVSASQPELSVPLELCRKIVQAHGGELNAWQRDNTFTYELDLPGIATAPETEHKSLTLLLVDHSPDPERPLLKQLAMRGHRVVPASPEAAADLPGRLHFDAAIWSGRPHPTLDKLRTTLEKVVVVEGPDWEQALGQ
jgi:hypothetical protein